MNHEDPNPRMWGDLKIETGTVSVGRPRGVRTGEYLSKQIDPAEAAFVAGAFECIGTPRVRAGRRGGKPDVEVYFDMKGSRGCTTVERIREILGTGHIGHAMKLSSNQQDGAKYVASRYRLKIGGWTAVEHLQRTIAPFLSEYGLSRFDTLWERFTTTSNDGDSNV